MVYQNFKQHALTSDLYPNYVDCIAIHLSAKIRAVLFWSMLIWAYTVHTKLSVRNFRSMQYSQYKTHTNLTDNKQQQQQQQ